MKFNRIITSGCSLTYGHGLKDVSNKHGDVNYELGPSPSAFPQLLGDKLGCEVLNVAMPGASNKRIGYCISEISDLNKNDLVIFNWTYLHRDFIIKRDFHKDSVYLHTFKNRRSKHYEINVQWNKFKAIGDPDQYDHLHNNCVWMLFGNAYARGRTTNIINFSMTDELYREKKTLKRKYNVHLEESLESIYSKFPKGTDNAHPGEDAHLAMANYIVKVITERNLL